MRQILINIVHEFTLPYNQSKVCVCLMSEGNMTRSRIDFQAGIGGVGREEREEGCMLLTIFVSKTAFVKNMTKKK